MSLRLIGIGTAVPELWVEQAEAARLSSSFCRVDPRRERLLGALYRRAGVAKRHSVLLEAGPGDSGPRQSFYPRARDETDGGPTTRQRMRRYEADAPPLGVAAARKAIEKAGIDPAGLTHAVTVSCTGFHAPGLDAALIGQLGLSRTIQRTHIGFMGCHGVLNAFRVAASFARADPQARVLVCAVELCSLHYFYGWDPEKLVANALFADGASAAVGVGSDASDDPDEWIVLANGTLLMPDSEDAMSWHIGDHGFHMSLSPRVPELIRAHVGGWMEEWLGKHRLSLADVGSWAVHPGGPRILRAFGEAVGLDDSALRVSREVLSEFGNMSSATILFIVDRLRKRGAERPCVALGFGPGLVVEAMLLG